MNPNRWIQVLVALGTGGILALAGHACGPEQKGGLSLDVRFAVIEQAQTGSGLPAELRSLEVVVGPGRDGTLMGSTGCLDLSTSAPERELLSLDVLPGLALAVTVSGWETAACSGDPQWRGIARGVEVIEGQETELSIYVTRQGLRLNPIRGRLPTPRAFSTATLLSDQRVLIAGGFEQVVQVSGALELVAACDALIYDPGSATIVRRLPLSACRGLHDALVLPGGQVLLVGGCGRAVFDPAGISRPMLRPKVDSLLSSAELYDPVTGSLVSVPAAAGLRRADAAAIALDDGRVALFGGRTDQLRSREVVTGSGSGSNWTFQTLADGLQTARSGAEALHLSAGILVAGGNLPGTVDLELFEDPFAGAPLVPNGQNLPALSLAGHSLTAIGGSSFMLAGGASSAPGETASNAVLTGIFSGDRLTLTAQSLTHPRAYHAAAMLLVMSQHLVVIAGGIDQTGIGAKDLELVHGQGQDGEPLADTLTTGAIGLAISTLPDGSLLLVGGLDLDAAGLASLSDQGQILTP